MKTTVRPRGTIMNEKRDVIGSKMTTKEERDQSRCMWTDRFGKERNDNDGVFAFFQVAHGIAVSADAAGDQQRANRWYTIRDMCIPPYKA